MLRRRVRERSLGGGIRVPHVAGYSRFNGSVTAEAKLQIGFGYTNGGVRFVPPGREGRDDRANGSPLTQSLFFCFCLTSVLLEMDRYPGI